MHLDKTKVVELRGGHATGRRMSVSHVSNQLVMRIAEGRRTITYRPTQERTADALEIWEADSGVGASDPGSTTV
jgi:hypothetical protein